MKIHIYTCCGCYREFFFSEERKTCMACGSELKGNKND